MIYPGYRVEILENVEIVKWPESVISRDDSWAYSCISTRGFLFATVILFIISTHTIPLSYLSTLPLILSLICPLFHSFSLLSVHSSTHSLSYLSTFPLIPLSYLSTPTIPLSYLSTSAIPLFICPLLQFLSLTVHSYNSTLLSVHFYPFWWQYLPLFFINFHNILTYFLNRRITIFIIIFSPSKV